MGDSPVIVFSELADYKIVRNASAVLFLYLTAHLISADICNPVLPGAGAHGLNKIFLEAKGSQAAFNTFGYMDKAVLSPAAMV